MRPSIAARYAKSFISFRQQIDDQPLEAQVDVRNVASWRMLEKCGYTREGLIRQGKMVNTWCDYYIYGILVDDLYKYSSDATK